MALGGEVIWEVQASGSNNNGGGFDPVSGTPGTDYTQGAGQTVISWLTSGGTYTNDLSITNATPSVVTSASYNFVAADVGNIINLTSGTNVTTGRYRIASVAANAATLDRNAMTGAPSADAEGYLGGAIGTWQAGLSAMDADGQVLYIKAGSYSAITSGLTLAAIGSLSDATRVVGYTTTRTDGGYAEITLSGSSLTGLTVSRSGFIIENIHIDCNSQTSSAGILVNNFYSILHNCKASNAAATGISNTAGYGSIQSCISYNCYTGFHNQAAETALIDCWAWDCGNIGFNSAAGAPRWIHCRATGCSTGFSGGYPLCLVNCTIDSCTTGLSASGSDYETYSHALMNLLVTNCTTGIALSGSFTSQQLIWIRNIAFYNNTTDVSGYTGTISGEVTLTADPYTDQVNDDFTLNSTAGGGADCQNAGVGNFDVGALQSDVGGGGTTYVIENQTTVIKPSWGAVGYRG